jgi:hypothetical protein
MKEMSIEKLSQKSKDYKVQTVDAIQKFADIKRERHIDAGGLLRVTRNAVTVMVDLPPGQIDDEGVASLSKFFADMVGKL